MYLHYYVDVHVQLFCMNQHIHMPCIILVAREEIANNFPLAKLVSLYDRQAYSDIPSHRCIFVLSKRVYFIFCFFVCGILNSRPFIRATIFSSIVQPATRHDCKMKILLLLKFWCKNCGMLFRLVSNMDKPNFGNITENTIVISRFSRLLNMVISFVVLSDASSSNEAVHLQQRLKSLSTELVTLRNRLHVGSITSAADATNNGMTITTNGTLGSAAKMTNGSNILSVDTTNKIKVSIPVGDLHCCMCVLF